MDSVVIPIQTLLAIAGGVMIGLAASSLLLTNGKIFGVSGILGGALTARTGAERYWRLSLVAGLVSGGFVLRMFAPELIGDAVTNSFGIVVAGLLVGLGTRLGNGCTSGHGVCGVARLSRRSIVATVTFTAAGIATVFVLRLFTGGWAI